MDIRRYDIVLADLSGAVGSEQGGTRPVLVVQNDAGNIFSACTIVMPLSTRLKSLNQPTHTLLKKDEDNGLIADSVVLGELIRVVSTERIKWKIGTVKNEEDRAEIRRVYQANFGE